MTPKDYQVPENRVSEKPSKLFKLITKKVLPIASISLLIGGLVLNQKWDLLDTYTYPYNNNGICIAVPKQGVNRRLPHPEFVICLGAPFKWGIETN